MDRLVRILTVPLFCLLALLLSARTASAQLIGVGPVDPAHGFPTSYTDAQNTQLNLCLNNSGMCLLTQAVELVNPALPFPANYGGTFPTEAFYWAGSATLTTNGGGQALLIMALEAAFLNGSVIPGEQVTFGRMRIRVDNCVPGAVYTITTPYGTFYETAVAAGRRGINFTSDIGFVPGNFQLALNSGIGPFLRWDSGLPLTDALGNQYIGDPAILHTVTGSPTGNNFFRIDGPDVGGPGVNSIQTDQFSIMGLAAAEVPPVASFTVAPNVGVAPLPVTFTSTSTGTITDVLWNFGDGTTSTLPVATHVYATAGSYNVTLTVNGPGGTNTAQQLGAVVVTEPVLPPVAAFSAAPTTGQVPLSVAFTDASTGTITSRLWSFGDGVTSTEQNPIYVYPTAGTFTVSLTVTGPGGANTLVRTGLITVTPPPQPPTPTLAAPTPGTAGVVNAFAISGFTPGARVTLLMATATGRSVLTIGGRRVTTGLSQPSILGTGIVGADGRVTLNIAIPANLRNRTRFLQAFDGTSLRFSNVVREVF
jgi:PKD repeat protein